MTGYLAVSNATGSSFIHDILVFAHYAFEYALPILGIGILLLLFRSSPDIRIWHLGIPLALGWLITGQYKALDSATEKIAHGGAAHIGTAVSNVSVGTLLFLIALIVVVVVLMRRQGEE